MGRIWWGYEGVIDVNTNVDLDGDGMGMGTDDDLSVHVHGCGRFYVRVVVKALWRECEHEHGVYRTVRYSPGTVR